MNYLKSLTFISIPLILFSCSESNTEILEHGDISCDKHLNEYKVILGTDFLEVDLSKLLSIAIYGNKIFMSDMVSKVVYYDTEISNLNVVSNLGRGPYEIQSNTFIIDDNVLYIYDTIQYKFIEYDILTEEFIREVTLENSYTGFILNATDNERIIKSTRRVGDTFYNDIISFKDDYETIDTLYVSESNDYIRHVEGGHSFLGQFPLFSNLSIVFVNNQGYIIDNTNYLICELQDNENCYDIEFEYVPDYAHFVKEMKAEFEVNQDLSTYFLEQALNNDDRKYKSMYKSVIAENDYFIFELFTNDKNAYLIYDMGKNEANVLCSEQNYNLVYIIEGNLYWVKDMGNYNYSLIQSKY